MKRIQIGRLRPRLPFVLLFLWGLFILYGTTIPFEFSASSAQVAAKVQQVFERQWHTASRMDIVSNVLLFLPWGFLCSVWLADLGAGCGVSLIVASLTGMALSIFVEFLQLYTPTRTTSLIDVATNFSGSVTGAVIGWPLARWASPLARPWLQRVVRRRPIIGCSLIVAAGLTITDLAPFDVSIDIGDLKSSIRSARPIPFGPAVDGSEYPAKPWSWARETLTWMIAGGLFVLAFRETGRTGFQAIGRSVAAAVGLSLAIEVVQLTIRSRVSDATSVVCALSGSMLGAMIVGRSGAVGSRRWLGPAVALWFMIAMIDAWTPVNFAWPDAKVLSPERLVPFMVYYRKTDIYALADLISQTMLFVPLGALLAARFPRVSARACVGIGFTLGLLLEFGQLFIIDRTGEITDALSAGCGAGLGLGLWRWGESISDPSRGVARYRVGSGDPSA
jgi:glycopeptide antibiotics resistance protein